MLLQNVAIIKKEIAVTILFKSMIKYSTYMSIAWGNVIFVLDLMFIILKLLSQIFGKSNEGGSTDFRPCSDSALIGLRRSDRVRKTSPHLDL